MKWQSREAPVRSVHFTYKSGTHRNHHRTDNSFIFQEKCNREHFTFYESALRESAVSNSPFSRKVQETANQIQEKCSMQPSIL